MSSYATTKVTVSKSQSDIRELLMKFGASGYSFGETQDEEGLNYAVIQFVHEGNAVRMRVPYKGTFVAAKKHCDNPRTRKSLKQIHSEMTLQEARRIWRVLHWNLKARLEAVEEGVESFTEAFMAHVLNPATGMTVYGELAENGRIELPSPMRVLEAGE